MVNAGDPDREGQLLVDEVLEHFNYRGPVARIWLPSLDDKSVRIALNGIRDNTPYAPLRDAARARSLADWLVGINATRALTIKGREGGHSKTLSLGRVQTPTLALVVARDREITNFKPVDYFVLRASLTHAAGEFTATFVPSETQAGLDASGRLVDFTQVAAVLEQVNGVEGLVTESLRENKSKAAPLPHSLSSLQKAASSRFGMSAQEVLDTAQSLYERKLTTYPRTDCRYLPVEQYQEAAAVLAALSSLPGLEQVAGTADASLKSAAWNTGKVTAHHAIAPTGELPPDNLKPEERSLYFMIATAFCLQFHPPMRYEARKIAVNLADTRWEVTGRRMVDAGWTAFSKDEEDDKQEEESLPPVEQGDAVTCRTVESVRKKTSPPSRFSEGTLIEAMANVHRFVGDAEAKATLRETKGIGTEATRAQGSRNPERARATWRLTKSPSFPRRWAGKSSTSPRPRSKTPSPRRNGSPALKPSPRAGKRSTPFLRSRRRFCRNSLPPFWATAGPRFSARTAARPEPPQAQEGRFVVLGLHGVSRLQGHPARRKRQARQGQTQTRAFGIRLPGLRQAPRQTLRRERRVLRLLRLSRLQEDLARRSERRSGLRGERQEEIKSVWPGGETILKKGSPSPPPLPS